MGVCRGPIAWPPRHDFPPSGFGSPSWSGGLDGVAESGSSRKRELLVARLRGRRRCSSDQPIHSSRGFRCLAAALKTSTATHRPDAFGAIEQRRRPAGRRLPQVMVLTEQRVEARHRDGGGECNADLVPELLLSLIGPPF